MVYTLPPRNAPNASFGNQLGNSVSQAFNQSFQKQNEKQFERGQLQQALGKLRSQSQNPNSSPTDVLYNLIEASSYSPEIGRNLPQLYAELNKAREAQNIKNVDFSGNGQRQKFQGSFGNQQPNDSNVEKTNFPNNVLRNQSPGNVPQEVTNGQARPVLSGEELLQKSQQRQQQLANNGIIKPFEDVYNQVLNENEQNRVYNQTVENDRLKRIQSQEKYGDLAEERLKKAFPNASDEETAIFKKIGEDASSQQKSQGEIDRFISQKVRDYKNSISNVEKNLNAPRIQNALKRSFLGENTDIKKAESDAKRAIQPILELGLYDKGRSLLQGSGFYPEERERIIFGEIPKEIKKSIDSIPKGIKEKNDYEVFGLKGLNKPNEQYSLKNKLNLIENISKTWGEGENQDINLLQMRKEYEDKNYDWRLFKDTMNELVENGFIKLTDDQQNQFNSYLNDPPLNNIEKIFQGLGLRGR